jgi:hypothetical protein
MFKSEHDRVTHLSLAMQHNREEWGPLHFDLNSVFVVIKFTSANKLTGMLTSSSMQKEIIPWPVNQLI